ncbi:MAG: penicillin binding protein transpeptidase domain-containing protein [Spirochaetia bacterium]|nr:penicillin binding protein transpeptidase domain-containing protein [Spirochaetia bacterium]
MNRIQSTGWMCAVFGFCLANVTSLHADPFDNKSGCFLLYSARAGGFLQEIGGQRCRDRYVACSTFKVPLAVMAFDSKVLKDETEVLRWDGKKAMIPEWERDHNAITWMKESVIWFSQRLTPRIGETRIIKYLNDFDYGNRDMSGGPTEAWLVAPDSQGSALKISAYEQIEFLRRLYSGTLPVSDRAMTLTKSLLRIETTPGGFSFSGKTGSNFFKAAPNEKHRRRLGWFIGRLARGSGSTPEEYFVVTTFHDLESTDDTVFGGRRAREITKEYLKARGLW